MLSTLLAFIAAVSLAALWSAGRAAAEAAARWGQQACARAGVTWLDHSVHLVDLRLRRGADGWLGLERHYAFEYSHTGEDRQRGRIVMQGRRLVSLLGPMPRDAVAPFT